MYVCMYAYVYMYRPVCILFLSEKECYFPLNIVDVICDQQYNIGCRNQIDVDNTL